MMEFAFYSQSLKDVVLEDSIFMAKDTSGDFLVSNSKQLKAQIYAPEIDFYIKNSSCDTLSLAKNVSLLYEARAVCFDLAQDLDYSQVVGKKLILVDENENLKQSLKEKGFDVLSLEANQIEWIDGHLGNLDVGISQNNEQYELQTDQIVWKNAPEVALKQSGVISSENDEEILQIACSKLGDYQYKNFITYNSNICQYHERREEICAKCESVCPTVAIIKDDEKKHLVFSHIDCHGCGGCISICPSGALDYSQMNKEGFYEISKLYKDKIPLIIPEKMDIQNLDVKLPQNVLPLAIMGEKFLHEAHFLTLLQESGSQVIFYTDFLSKGSRNAIFMINQTYELKWGKKAIFVCENKDELEVALSEVNLLQDSYNSTWQENLNKREIFNKRLKFIVANENLGSIKTTEFVNYGSIKVNESNCTLCLSCVGACNVGALIADVKENALKFNESACTACGYCLVSCAEKDCISLECGEISLKPERFEIQTLAKDELFNCIECQKPFATKKSVLRVAKMMTPLFGGDEDKIKTLYCCGDCKPKIMARKLINFEAV